MLPGPHIITSGLLHSTGLVVSGISTRRGGVSPEPFGMNLSYHVGDSGGNVTANRGLFARALGIRSDQFAIPAQEHGTLVRRADSAGSYPACDGLVTDVPGVCLCITVADCVPIFIVDVGRKAIAALHAGWRGTTGGVAGRGVSLLIREFGSRPEQMVAYLGPCAGLCCYAVGSEVAARFSQEFIVSDREKTLVDLRGANVSQLVAAGIRRESIEVSPDCTIHQSDLFHSYRREGASSGRMMAVIGLR